MDYGLLDYFDLRVGKSRDLPVRVFPSPTYFVLAVQWKTRYCGCDDNLWSKRSLRTTSRLVPPPPAPPCRAKGGCVLHLAKSASVVQTACVYFSHQFQISVAG